MNKAMIAICTVLVLYITLWPAWAEDSNVAAPPTIPTVEAPKPFAMPDVKPGDILQVQPDSGLKVVDMSKFYVLGIEWLGPQPNGIEYGLRADGVVIWRRKP